MNRIADETDWMGWEADGENCGTYYRPSEIKRQRALRIMCRLWKVLFERQFAAHATAPRPQRM
jgi:hypothetical protein